MNKAHGQEDQVCRMYFFAARHFLHLAVLPFELDGFQACELAFFADELFSSNGKNALAAFFVARGCAQLEWPVRPSQLFIFLLGRHGHEFKLCHASGALAVGCAHAITARIAATNHDDAFAVCANLVFEFIARVDFVLLRQELHGEMHTSQIAARHRQVAALFRAACQ